MSSDDPASPLMSPLKIILIGDMNAGKTCFLNRLVDDCYFQDAPTTGAEFRCLPLSLPSGLCVKLHLWDTAGQERYRCLSTMYYRKAHGVLFFYDSTIHGTRETAETLLALWRKDLAAYAPPDIPIALVATKSDDADAKAPEVSTTAFISSAIETKEALLTKVVVPLVDKILAKRRVAEAAKATKAAQTTTSNPTHNRTIRVTAAPPKKKSGGCC